MKVRTFSPAGDEKIKKPVKNSAKARGISYHHLDDLEEYLKKSFGSDLHFSRAPFFTVCRVGNRYAIKQLLNKGIKTGDKYLLGLTPPEVCFYSRGGKGLKEYIDLFELSGQKLFSVSGNLLEEVFKYPDLLAKLKVTVKLGLIKIALRSNIDEISQDIEPWFI